MPILTQTAQPGHRRSRVILVIAVAVVLLVIAPISLAFNPNGCRIGKFVVVAQFANLPNSVDLSQGLQSSIQEIHGFQLGSTAYERGPKSGIPTGFYLLVVWRSVLIFQWFDISTAKQVRAAPR